MKYLVIQLHLTWWQLIFIVQEQETLILPVLQGCWPYLNLEVTVLTLKRMFGHLDCAYVLSH